MINTNNIINELRNINYQFLENNKNGLKINNKNYKFKEGRIPILLSAPHAVKQERENKTKPSDYLTGALTIFLAERCNCSFIVRTYNNQDDPNYPLGETLQQIENSYLKAVTTIISEYKQILVIDIHGCKDTKKSDCSLWHNNFHCCNPQIIKIYENNFNQFDLSCDNGYEYLGGQVTRQSSQLTNAFQLEIKRKIRSLKKENFYLLKSFLDATEKSINETFTYYQKEEKVRRLKNEYKR